MKSPTEEQRKRFYNLLDSAWSVGIGAIEHFGAGEQTAMAVEELGNKTKRLGELLGRVET